MDLGRSLAAGLKAGDVVAFYGDLGAGKTTMAKGICEGLGITDVVKSPSFVIITEYATAPNAKRRSSSADPDFRTTIPDAVFHIDLYRIAEGAQPATDGELAGIDFEGYLEAGGVCLIEWAERAEALLPTRTIRVRLAFADGGRRIEIERPS